MVVAASPVYDVPLQEDVGSVSIKIHQNVRVDNYLKQIQMQLML